MWYKAIWNSAMNTSLSYAPKIQLFFSNIWWFTLTYCGGSLLATCGLGDWCRSMARSSLLSPKPIFASMWKMAFQFRPRRKREHRVLLFNRDHEKEKVGRAYAYLYLCYQLDKLSRSYDCLHLRGHESIQACVWEVVRSTSPKLKSKTLICCSVPNGCI